MITVWLTSLVWMVVLCVVLCVYTRRLRNYSMSNLALYQQKCSLSEYVRTQSAVIVDQREYIASLIAPHVDNGGDMDDEVVMLEEIFKLQDPRK